MVETYICDPLSGVGLLYAGLVVSAWMGPTQIRESLKHIVNHFVNEHGPLLARAVPKLKIVPDSFPEPPSNLPIQHRTCVYATTACRPGPSGHRQQVGDIVLSEFLQLLLSSALNATEV